MDNSFKTGDNYVVKDILLIFHEDFLIILIVNKCLFVTDSSYYIISKWQYIIMPFIRI